MNLDARIPDGPIQDKWDKRRFDLKLVNPANKRKYKVLVVGSGLAGAAAAASMGELGYQVAGVVIRAVVRDNYFQVVIGLRQRASQGMSQQTIGAVIGRNTNGD